MSHLQNSSWNNARIKDIAEFSDGNGNKIIVHAELDLGNGFLQLGAANLSYKLVLPPDEDNACYSLAIYVADVDQVFENAVARGAKIREPIANFVSGDRFGSILDPFGVRWTIMTRIEDLSEEESVRRVKEWADSFKSNVNYLYTHFYYTRIDHWSKIKYNIIHKQQKQENI